MTNDVVLSAALRSNLLSLQQTSNQIGVHQNRLATGKKVNSALDSPQAFFAAQSLTNRANDLSTLLDSIGQSIQVINAANNGVTALTTLVTQAQSLANTAQSTLAGASTQATVTGTADLGGPASPKKLNTISGVATNDTIIFTVTDPAGGASPISAQTITIAANDTSADLVTKINDLNTSLTTPAIQASLDSSNHLVLTAINGGNLNVKFVTAAATNAANQASAAAFGFNNVAQLNLNGNAVSTVDFTATPNSALTSRALYSTGPTTLATASTLLNASLKDSTNTAVGTLVAGDTYTLKVGGKTSANLLVYGGATATTATIQTLIDGINNDTSIKSLVSASFDATTGKISITSKDASATDVQFALVTSTAAIKKLDLGFGTNSMNTTANINAGATEDIRFGAAAGTLASLQTQYNTTLSQIDALVKDTGYAGTNLLNGNNLTTYFNESRTSSLTTTGGTFTSSGLSLTSANFQSTSAISTSITQTQNALTTIRNYGSTLSTNLSIIQNRQSFTTNLINTLQTGSDALTNADQNEEGATLLALQTRQSLGITSLSLASQSQQAILKLF
jgi:flagellin